MDKSIVVVKNNHRGEEVWRYPGVVQKQTQSGILIEAFFNHSDVEFNQIHLKKGDRFLEVYPFGKWFNVYEIYERDDGKLKCWYCNFTRPVKISDQQVMFDDLALDLLVYPDGRQLILDEEEFADLHLPEEEREQVWEGLRALQAFFQNNKTTDIFSLI